MSNVKGISIVIPNYNGVSLFRETLPTVMEAATGSNLPFEIIVVDDCSTDDSISFLQQHYPAVIVLKNEKNLGFSPTINKGVFHARHSHVLFLNSDVKLTPGYFNGLLRYFDDASTFGVMSRIQGWESDKIQDGGKYPYFHGLKIKTSGNYVPAEPAPGQWLYSMYLSGANAFVDREKMLLLKGFNEMFAPFYIEDYELSIRAWRMGWTCYYDHLTVCLHKESATIRSAAKKKAINKVYVRNKMYLHALHLPKLKLALWHIQQILESLVHAVAGRPYYLQSFREYLGNISRIRASRRVLQALAASKGVKLRSLHEVADLVENEMKKIKVTLLK